MSLYGIFYDLTRLEMQLWDRVDTALRAAVDVPLGRFEALLVMRRLGPCRIQDVSRELSLTVGGTSKLVDRLEATGLCARAANPDDRRSSLITLTDRALPLVEDGEAVIESTLRTLLGATLPAKDLTALGAQLHRLRHAGQPAAGGS
jgi:DNA-binding MarR family transcriptional regulator